MTEASGRPPAEDELHAYADGQLPPERQRAVLAWLAETPADAARVSAWQAQNAAIRAAFAGDADPDADLRLIRALRGREAGWPARWRLAAAAVLLLALGGAAGVLATRALDGQADAAPSLSEASRDSYVIYAGEVRHPVEVGAEQEPHLVAWLGKRLDAPLAAPDLSPLGLRLVGGRLVPFGGAPGAMLMYEDASGARVTCLIARDQQATAEGFRFATREGVSTVSWGERGLGYALSASFGRERLLAIANAVQAQS